MNTWIALCLLRDPNQGKCDQDSDLSVVSYFVKWEMFSKLALPAKAFSVRILLFG